MKNLLEQLKTLRSITPDKYYILRSKTIILNSSRTSFRPVLSLRSFGIWNTALTGAFMILFVFISYQAISSQQPAFASLMDENLRKEMQKIEQEIDQPTLNYYTNSSRAVSSALNEISIDEGTHLNSRLLQRESEKLRIENPVNHEINDLLDKVSL